MRPSDFPVCALLVVLLLTACRDDRGDGAETRPPQATRVKASLEEVPEPARPAHQAPGTSSRPADGWADRLGDTPGHAATPVRKSAASRPAPAAFQPLADARPGEWAEYRTLEHGRLRYEVVEVGAARVRTRVHLTKGGQPLGEPAIREDRPEYDPVLHRDAYHQPEITCESQKLDLAGRSWDARRCESRWVDEEIHYLRKTWLSAEAPVYGLLRMDLYGDERLEASLELSAFGGADP